MSSSDVAISVRGLSKSYTIAHGSLRRPTFRETLMDRLRHPLKGSQSETFWALKDVSFQIKKGDVVGIIGRNGAGKSTLLKILSRITQPTAGEIDLYGRVGSLLEVGTGFHPELTGRENIYLNGSILGMRRREIDRQFDAIVDFAEVEKFLDTPVKRYSSGMYVRLAFAVAAHLNPEILIVDEVLAVGDTEFQKKCLGKMGEVAQTGRTVLFVSHNMAVVQRLCSRALLIEWGRIAASGPANEIVLGYVTAEGRRRSGSAGRDGAPETAAWISSWSVSRDGGDKALDEHSTRSGQDVSILLSVEFAESVPNIVYGLALWSNEGVLAWAGTSCSSGESSESFKSGRYHVIFRIKGLALNAGQYRIEVSINAANRQLDRWQAQPELTVLPRRPDTVPPAWQGVADFDHVCEAIPIGTLATTGGTI